jgi:cell division protein FtsB
MLDLKTTLIAATVSLVIGLSAGWAANGWRLNGKIDRMIAEHSQAMAVAGQNAMMESARLQKLKDEALNEANRIAQANAKAAADARSQLDRLRRQLANATDLSTATCPSTRDYAATLATVFGECATRIGELAEKADGHAADSATLNGAWPR